MDLGPQSASRCFGECIAAAALPVIEAACPHDADSLTRHRFQADALAEFNCSCADLLTHATSEPSDPFPHTLAAFPVRLQALQPPSFTTSATAAPAHIPAHLPAFPDAHTCATATPRHCTCPSSAAFIAEDA